MRIVSRSAVALALTVALLVPAASGPPPARADRSLVPGREGPAQPQCIYILNGQYLFQVFADGSIWGAAYWDRDAGAAGIGAVYISQGLDTFQFNDTKGRMADQTGILWRANNQDDLEPVTARVKASFTLGKKGKFKIIDQTAGVTVSGRGTPTIANCG
jgi:hypothetical protein